MWLTLAIWRTPRWAAVSAILLRGIVRFHRSEGIVKDYGRRAETFLSQPRFRLGIRLIRDDRYHLMAASKSSLFGQIS
jgi:hypothetical protein